MSGINRDIYPDPRISLIYRHLPGTTQVQRLLRKERTAHVFNDLDTLEQVTSVIIQRGECTDNQDDDYERYGLYFSEAIGYIIKANESKIR